MQDPTNAQNYNRYSYVLNNPLKYTDPTGNETVGGSSFDRGAAAWASNVISHAHDYESWEHFLNQEKIDMYLEITSGGGGAGSPVSGLNMGDVLASLESATSKESCLGFQEAVWMQGKIGKGDRRVGVWYINESIAYSLLYNNTDGKEQSAFITTEGVYLMPSYKNDNTTSSWIPYGYSISKNANGERYTLSLNGIVISSNVVAHIHTHRDENYGAGLSPEDIKTSYLAGGLPMIVMGWDGKVYGGWGTTPPPNSVYGSSRNNIDFRGVSNQMLMNGSVGLINFFSKFRR